MMIITNNLFHQIIVNPLAEKTQIGVKFKIHHITGVHLFLRVQVLINGLHYGVTLLLTQDFSRLKLLRFPTHYSYIAFGLECFNC